MATDQTFKTKKMEKPVAALYGRAYNHGHWEDMERGYTAEKRELLDPPTQIYGTPPVYRLV